MELRRSTLGRLSRILTKAEAVATVPEQTPAAPLAPPAEQPHRQRERRLPAGPTPLDAMQAQLDHPFIAKRSGTSRSIAREADADATRQSRTATGGPGYREFAGTNRKGSTVALRAILESRSARQPLPPRRPSHLHQQRYRLKQVGSGVLVDDDALITGCWSIRN